MSAASLLKVYDGLDPELAFQTAAPGTAENIAQVLANAPAGVAGGLPLTDVGAFSCDSITSVNAGLFTIAGAAGQGVSVVGPVGASLVATTGGAAVTSTAGAITLTAGAAAPGGLVLAGVGLPATAAASAAAFAAAGTGGALATHYLQVSIGSPAVAYYIPMSSVVW